MLTLLWILAAILLLIWLIGLIAGVLGNLVWIFLVVGAILVLFALLTGRRTAP